MSQPVLFEPDGALGKALRGRAGGRTRDGLPWSGRTALSSHHSALAAQEAAPARGEKTRQYLAILAAAGQGGLTDHDAARALGVPLSSINSIRNGCGPIVEPNTDRHGLSPWGRRVTLWRTTTR